MPRQPHEAAAASRRIGRPSQQHDEGPHVLLARHSTRSRGRSLRLELPIGRSLSLFSLGFMWFLALLPLWQLHMHLPESTCWHRCLSSICTSICQRAHSDIVRWRRPSHFPPVLATIRCQLRIHDGIPFAFSCSAVYECAQHRR